MAFEGLTEKLAAAFKRLKNKGKLNEDDIKVAMREVRLALLEADVNYKVAKEFIKNVSERSVGVAVLESLTPAQQVIKIVDEELVKIMGTNETRLNTSSKPPSVIMMCGLQGSGKTTHSGKLALMLKKQGHRPLLVACDIYRPAAIKQLEVVAGSVAVPFFEMGQIDPVEIAKKAIAHAKDHGNDYVILDTAGRLHIDEELMKELQNIKEEAKPTDILLVVDSMTGQDAVNVAEKFNQTLEVDGVILTKLDGDTRGGAALSVRHVTGKPIKFVGLGEKMTDLEPFYPDRMASRILGMGDILSLIEKAQNEIDDKEAIALAKKFQNNSFDMYDLLAQLKQIKKLGSISQILKMLPGANKIDPNSVDESSLFRTESIILSMTDKERRKPTIINPSRKRRIAAGSGTSVQQVNQLLKQYEQMQMLMKKMGGGKKGKKRFGLGALGGLGNVNPGGFMKK